MKAPIIIATSLTLIATHALGSDRSATFTGKDYQAKVVEQTKLGISHDGGPSLVFDSEFTIFYSAKSPQKSMRRPDVGKNQEETVLYKVPTWGRTELKKIDPSEHVMDGFDPATDRELEQGRTANYFLAAPYTRVRAVMSKATEDGLEWVFEEQEHFTLSAKVICTPKSTQPVLTWTLTPKTAGYFSVGYTGAPSQSPKAVDEIWQPLIWQEKRFPNLPYLTEAFLCPVPSALVSHKGMTVGVLADPKHIPFMPLPKTHNSQFGVMVRNGKGLAQPSLFAPVLGGKSSKLNAGDSHTFKAHLICRKQSLLDTYEFLGREYYGFRDYRKNTTVTLNQTFDNMIEYCMSNYSRFDPSLRGCSYSTDVPGAVKNITGLHPLSLAFVTDNEDIYIHRARPMVEYGYSRERFLFATDPTIKRDGTSARLEGPGVPMSDYSAVFTFSQNRMQNYLKQAQEIYDKPIHRSLNLTAQLYGDRWQNALALYKATGEKAYLDAAIKGADDYIANRMDTLPVDFNDKESRGIFFWTSYAPQWMELYLLYEASNEKRFLEAAHTGARRFAQFVYLCPVIPNQQVTVNPGGKVPRYRGGNRFEDMLVPETSVDAWEVSEIGLTPESSPTCQGHRAKYLAQYASWFLRIAADTNDALLHDMARSAIIGRYESFPGYHINAGRTTAHGMANFALREHKELNGVTSMHYNHPWPHAALIFDYLVSDVYYRSNGALDFPSEYAEGYAYCRSKVYGAQPGTFYDGSKMHLYMPKDLLKSSNVQINYLAARTSSDLILMLTNQSTKDATTTLTLNQELMALLGEKEGVVEIWKEGKKTSTGAVKDGTIQVEVPAMGLTSINIKGLTVKPRFQDKIFAEKPGSWSKDQDRLDFGGGTEALLLDFGPELQSVYSYTKANGTVFKSVEFHYACDGKWKSVKKSSFPFEFTVSVPKGTKTFTYRYEATTTKGDMSVSKEGSLSQR